MTKTLLSLGHGYSAQGLARILPDDWQIIATTRSSEKAQALEAPNVAARVWPGTDLHADLARATHVLASIAPGADGDPILAEYASALKEAIKAVFSKP